MRKGIIKVIFIIMYFLAAGVVSTFIPHQLKFAIGFAFAFASVWAWKTITSSSTETLTLDPEGKEALREFVCTVYIMRDAQRCYDVVPEGRYLIKKLEFEGRVDEDLKALVSREVDQEWKARKEHRKEVDNG